MDHLSFGVAIPWERGMFKLESSVGESDVLPMFFPGFTVEYRPLIAGSIKMSVTKVLCLLIICVPSRPDGLRGDQLPIQQNNLPEILPRNRLHRQQMTQQHLLLRIQLVLQRRNHQIILLRLRHPSLLRFLPYHHNPAVLHQKALLSL